MKLCPVVSSKEMREFLALPEKIYQGNPHYRATEGDIVKLLVQGPSVFHERATVKPFLIQRDGQTVGRFALIVDSKLPDNLQIAFFEAMPGLPQIIEIILDQARRSEPQCGRFTIGLNGHLNYSAGVLLDHFDKAPVFGLPYNPAYYPEYFEGLHSRTMVSYRFPTHSFAAYQEKMKTQLEQSGITVRTLDRSKLRQELELYTRLNNACFSEHPLWADRTSDEDFELFHPFRWLLREEFFLFAQYQGKDIGFLLWYPDFNELVKGQQHLGLRQVLRFKWKDPIKTLRYTQIAVLPELRSSMATLALTLALTHYGLQSGYETCEGGFIFEENRESILMTEKFLHRVFGVKFEPYRHFAIYEGYLR